MRWHSVSWHRMSSHDAVIRPSDTSSPPVNTSLTLWHLTSCHAASWDDILDDDTVCHDTSRMPWHAHTASIANHKFRWSLPNVILLIQINSNNFPSSIYELQETSSKSRESSCKLGRVKRCQTIKHSNHRHYNKTSVTCHLSIWAFFRSTCSRCLCISFSCCVRAFSTSIFSCCMFACVSTTLLVLLTYWITGRLNTESSRTRI